MLTKRFSWLLLLALLTISLLLTGCSSATSSPAATATPAPLATSAPTEVAVPTATDVATVADSLQILLDTGSVATSFRTETIAAVPAGADVPYWELLPEFTQVTLEGYPISNHLMQPQIFIYPVNDLMTVNEAAVLIVASLQSLLQSPQEIPDMPFLPLFNATQAMHVHVQYLDFKSGQGLRYLTEFAQGLGPINNFELIYTYQGLSRDGNFYVAAVLPVNHPSLPADGTITGNEPPEFSSDFPKYLIDVINALNPQAAGSFTPDLTELDALMSSLQINGVQVP